MKIAYILPKYDPNSPEHYCHHYSFLESLARKAEVYLIINNSYGEPEFAQVIKTYRLKSRFMPFRFLEEFLVLAWAWLKGYRRFYAHYSFLGGMAAGLLTKLLGGRAFYWNCGMTKEFTPKADAGPLAHFRYFLHSLPLEMTLRLTDFLVTGTPSMARYYLQHYRLPPDKVKVLPNFIATKRFAPVDQIHARVYLGLPPESLVLLFFHRLAPRKGAHHLVPLIQRLRNRGAGRFVLVIGGGGPYLKILRDEVQRSGFEAFVHLHGWVPNRLAPYYFSAANLFLMPSEEEGFPRVLLEAMACGCPFVATDVGGVRDILTPLQQQFLVPRGDLDAFAEKVMGLMKDPALRVELAEEGRRHVIRFSEEAVGKAFLQLMADEPVVAAFGDSG